jgi:hypothetical protein
MTEASDAFEEELGPAVGAATHEEVVRALREHSSGPAIVRVTAQDGTIVLQTEGWTAWVDALGFYADDENEGSRVVLVPSGGERKERVWNPVRRQHEFRPHAGQEVTVPDGEITRHIGGFSVAAPDGTVTAICLWRAVGHVTESGDIAPGLGGFSTEMEEDDTDAADP